MSKKEQVKQSNQAKKASIIKKKTNYENEMDTNSKSKSEETTFKRKRKEKKNIKTKSNYASKKDFHTLEVVVLVILTCLISLVGGSILGVRLSKKKNQIQNIPVADSDVQNFLKDYYYLLENYYGDLDQKELLNTAFKSIVDSLEDAYSGTLDENTSNNFNVELEGQYEGLGVEIINDQSNNIIVHSIIPNSPASKADIQKDDRIIRVNDVEVSGMKTTDFIKNVIKGSGDTNFNILLERNGQQKTIELKLEKITLQSVESKLYEEKGKKIGYLKVKVFALNTYEQFKLELETLEKKGIHSLIIDLRDNSGGHLTSVKEMIGLFLDRSHVIYQTQDKNQTVKVYSTGDKTRKYPIAILGNEFSASASEVMIGALTEEYDAVLVGQQTFGKGTVQELHTLSNGDEYKFTTKKWLTPKGHWIHNKGFEPKIKVALDPEYYENPNEENDKQLKTALDYLQRRN